MKNTIIKEAVYHNTKITLELEESGLYIIKYRRTKIRVGGDTYKAFDLYQDFIWDAEHYPKETLGIK